MLACGYEGVGRLWNVDEIVAKADEILLRGERQANEPAQSQKKSSEKRKKFVDVFF